MEKLHHLGFDDSHGAKYALLPGDPGRVEKIAAYLDGAEFYCQKREYTTWLGTLDGEKVLVMSTGMGGPSTAIALEELHMCGVDTVLRIGTAGGMQTDIMPGDVVVAQAAIRMEGTSKEYVPIEFPAVANLQVCNAMVQAAKNKGLACHAGVVHCKDSFYGQHNPARMPVGYELENKWEAWRRAGCLVSEMESAALFIVASTLGMRAGCALTVAGNQERLRAGLPTERFTDTAPGIETAVEATRLLIAADKG